MVDAIYLAKLILYTLKNLISQYKELNDRQREAVEEIFRSIETDPEQSIIVNGMPGSGKTIVAIFLFKYLIDYVDEYGQQLYKNKKIALVIPQTSLTSTKKYN